MRRRPVRLGVFLATGLALAAALAFFLGPRASGEPDGLERVAVDEGFADAETDHALSDAPTAGYGVEGVDDPRLGTGLAGLIGVGVTFALAGGLFLLARRTGGGRPARQPRSGTEPSATPG